MFTNIDDLSIKEVRNKNLIPESANMWTSLTKCERESIVNSEDY